MIENENLIERIGAAKGLESDIKEFLIQILRAPIGSNSESQMKRYLDEATEVPDEN